MLLVSTEGRFVTGNFNAGFSGISAVEAMYFDCCPILPNGLAYFEHIFVEHKGILYNTFQALL